MRFQSPYPLLGLLLTTGACGVESTGAAEPVATTTHALLRVERSDLVGAPDAATAMAFAGIVRVPEAADPEPLLRLSGKGLTLPPAGYCAPSEREREVAAPDDVGRAEFLDAGDVLLRTSGAETLLAPRLFGSSQAELSGVVYTSRDKASEPLPGGDAYLLRTTGSEQLPAIELRVQAPELLSEVFVAGTALAEVQELTGGSETPLSWRAGDARDLVYVAVSDADSGTLGVCVFRDAQGHGTLPRGLFGAQGAGSLAFHRLREVAADIGALAAAEARFDFELAAAVSFR